MGTSEGVFLVKIPVVAAFDKREIIEELENKDPIQLVSCLKMLIKIVITCNRDLLRSIDLPHYISRGCTSSRYGTLHVSYFC